MSDLIIPEDGGLAIVLKSFDNYYLKDKEYAHEILECLALNSARRMLSGERFITLVQIDYKDLKLEDIGKHPIVWNLHEGV